MPYNASLAQTTIDTTIPGPPEIEEKPNYVLIASVVVLVVAVIVFAVITLLKRKHAASQPTPKEPEAVTVKPTKKAAANTAEDNKA